MHLDKCRLDNTEHGLSVLFLLSTTSYKYFIKALHYKADLVFLLVSVLQLCEYLEELLNVNGELRSEGQALWTLLGGILGQVPSHNINKHSSMLALTLTKIQAQGNDVK